METPDLTSESLLTIARVIRAHGVRGELVCDIITDFPQRFRVTRAVYVSRGPRPSIRYEVQRTRLVTAGPLQRVILKLEGVDDREAADGLRLSLVQVPETQAWKLPSGRYFWHQIVGLRVETTAGRSLGTVSEILETGANEVYVVQSDGGELLVPAIKDVVREIAPDRGVVIVELLPGMEQDRTPRNVRRRDSERRNDQAT